MQKIAVITDSGCDLSQETIKENNIQVLPFRIIYSDREYLDKVTISEEQVYEDLSNGIIPTTSLPDLQYTENIIRKLKDEGLSFSKLILEERMMMAQRLLIYSNHTVGKVAGICGYDNASYFVSVFRGYFGVPPHQYLSRFS